MMHPPIAKFCNDINVFCVTMIIALMLNGCGGGGGGGGGAQKIINKLPSATISSPKQTEFKEGDNIAFIGSAKDEEDGELKGAALIWKSDLDGEFGKGGTLITSALSAGEHKITLSAKDSEDDIFTTEPLTINIAQSRFIKIGMLTAASITDAANAFDGDYDTAATIAMSDSESDDEADLYFKAYVGTENVFFFNIKLGETSLSGLSLKFEKLDADGVWQRIGRAYLYEEKTVTIYIPEAQKFADSDGYINIRAHADYSEEPEDIIIYEIWRVDPVYGGSQTQEVTAPVYAFDNRTLTAATISTPWNPENPAGKQNFLHFCGYIGIGLLDKFSFDVQHNRIGPLHALTIEVENPTSEKWEALETLSLDTETIKRVSVSNAQTFADNNGHINLRASWTTSSPELLVEGLKIFEIQRKDLFFIGPQSATKDQIYKPERTVDGNLDSNGIIYYFWGELDHFDFLHLQAYTGDASPFSFSVKAGPSAPDLKAKLIIDGQIGADKWEMLDQIDLDSLKTISIELVNGRPYIDAKGLINLRVRWESGSSLHDANVYEVWRD